MAVSIWVNSACARLHGLGSLDGPHDGKGQGRQEDDNADDDQELDQCEGRRRAPSGAGGGNADALPSELTADL